jgi:hypothetical protein
MDIKLGWVAHTIVIAAHISSKLLHNGDVYTSLSGHGMSFEERSKRMANDCYFSRDQSIQY